MTERVNWHECLQPVVCYVTQALFIELNHYFVKVGEHLLCLSIKWAFLCTSDGECLCKLLFLCVIKVELQHLITTKINFWKLKALRLNSSRAGSTFTNPCLKYFLPTCDPFAFLGCHKATIAELLEMNFSSAPASNTYFPALLWVKPDPAQKTKNWCVVVEARTLWLSDCGLITQEGKHTIQGTS